MRSAAINAYKTAQMSAVPNEQIERIAFERAIGMLRRAAANVRDYHVYASALRFNQTLWTLIQAGLSDGDIQLPAHLKSNFLLLSFQEYINLIL